MRYDKVIKRENGDKVIITVRYNEYSDGFRTSVSLIPKGKRKPVFDTSNTSFGDDVPHYRQLSMTERARYRQDLILQYVSMDEIREARDGLLDIMRTDSFIF